MRVSFIGGGVQVRNICQLLKKSPDFEIGGFFSNPLSLCLDNAIETNGIIYPSLDDLCENSDCIILCVPDKILPALITSLSRLHTNGKIIVSTSYEVYASDLANGYDNTFIVMNTSADFEKVSSDLDNITIVCEGMGKDLDIFIDFVKNGGIKCSHVTRDELMLYRCAIELMTVGISSVIKASSYLAGVATGKRENLKPAIKEGLSIKSFEGMYTLGNFDDLCEKLKLMRNIGLDSVLEIYKTVSSYNVENNCEDIYLKDRIKTAIKKS